MPPHPGLTSAMGLLQTDVRHLYLRSAVGLLSSYPVVEINRIFAELRRRALDDVEEEGSTSRRCGSSSSSTCAT